MVETCSSHAGAVPGVKSIDHFREQLRIEGVEPRSGGANADNGSQGTWTAWH